MKFIYFNCILWMFMISTSFAQSSLPDIKFFKYKPIYPGSVTDDLSIEDAMTPKCSDLISFISVKGQKVGKVDGFQLSTSSWLKSVVGYEYNNMIFTVVTVKRDEYALDEKSYIFCKIPIQNWQRFSQPVYSLDKTYGEKFHLYIVDFKCDCK